MRARIRHSRMGMSARTSACVGVGVCEEEKNAGDLLAESRLHVRESAGHACQLLGRLGSLRREEFLPPAFFVRVWAGKTPRMSRALQAAGRGGRGVGGGKRGGGGEAIQMKTILPPCDSNSREEDVGGLPALGEEGG